MFCSCITLSQPVLRVKRKGKIPKRQIFFFLFTFCVVSFTCQGLFGCYLSFLFSFFSFLFFLFLFPHFSFPFSPSFSLFFYFIIGRSFLPLSSPFSSLPLSFLFILLFSFLFSFSLRLPHRMLIFFYFIFPSTSLFLFPSLSRLSFPSFPLTPSACIPCK